MPKDYKKWYATNRAKIAARRRERYQNDPEYREKVLSRRRDQRGAGQVELPQSAATDPVIRRGPDGELHEGWRRGTVAEKCGVSVSTVKRLLPKFPAPTLEGAQRAYTAHQLALIAAHHSKIDDPDVRAQVEASWGDDHK